MSEQSARKVKRRIRRYILVPAIAVLMIAVGALTMHAAVRASQTRADAEVVKKPVTLEHVQAVPMYADVMSHIGKLPEGCRAVTIPAWDESTPPANAITIEEAAAIGAWNIQLALDAAVTGDIFVQYSQYDGVTGGEYTIYAGGADTLAASSWEDAPYYCSLNAITGEMNMVSWYGTPGEQELAQSKSKADTRTREERQALMETARKDPEVEKRAIEFITKKYLREGQKIVSTFIDGVQWAFRGEGNAAVLLDCYVTVQPGTSYCLRIGYPGYGVEIVTAYNEAAAANELAFDVEWVKQVKEAEKAQEAQPNTATPTAPKRPETEEEFWASVHKRMKAYGVEGDFSNPANPHVFVDQAGNLVIIDPNPAVASTDTAESFILPGETYILPVMEGMKLEGFYSYEKHLEETASSNDAYLKGHA